MIVAYHLTLGAYGFWLPNDPRGSWSDYVGSVALRRFGHATRIRTRESLAHQEHDQQLRQAAKKALKFPPIEFNGLQARAVAHGFRAAIAEQGYIFHACAIMPSHVHVVIARHERPIERIATHLKAKATMQLRAENLLPVNDGPLWERGAWHVYLDDPSMVFNAIRYVEANPEASELPPQSWTFVSQYDVPH